MSEVIHYYQRPALSDGKLREKLNRLRKVSSSVISLDSEFCYNVECTGRLTADETKVLEWVLSSTFGGHQGNTLTSALASEPTANSLLVEIGPRLNFSTPFSTNAVAICRAVGLANKVGRLERSTVYRIVLESGVNGLLEATLVAALHDRMTEQRYLRPITSFKLDIVSQPWRTIDVMGQGTLALANVSRELGLAFDDQDLVYYTKLFGETLKRNPTSVECFDLAQSNSEHSRHWFFKGLMVIDGKEVNESLIDMIIETQAHTNQNNLIKFSDNSSAIRGFSDLRILGPANSSEASLVTVKDGITRHIIFTAETHNFPTGVAPFQGATTGTGGRIRDVQAAGRGGHVIAGTAGYCFGNLHIPGYELPWESGSEVYPPNFAPPLDICIEASNGASDYGNKFGEPLITGFSRSFGMRLNGERREYIKPIMFSGGIGTIDEKFIGKEDAEPGMLVVKVGGPIYRIGVGGGAASSVDIQGDQVNEDLDFGAVQRGDPEMEQKLNRVIRACMEYAVNPIQSIHDQGAGGNGNVLKEIVHPQGAVFHTNRFSLGDPTINTMELWGAEFQESDAILVKPGDRELLVKIGQREKCPVDFVGEVTGDGFVRLIETDDQVDLPVNLHLEHVLGSMPRKVFPLERQLNVLRPLALPAQLTVLEALNRVLRLPSVASKRYLTNKVDRSVTGLVAQQQCIGPLHTPLADYGLIALSYFNRVGAATSIGEQPLKGLISAVANARMTVAESLTNLMFVCVTELRDVKCSGNWMWPAKLKGEGALLVDTCEAMCTVMSQLGVAIDGGKDSLSMAAKVKLAPNKFEIVKSPNSLVISTYAPVPDVNLKVTPLLKGTGKLVFIDLSGRQGAARSGASALAQVFGQVGDSTPDLDDPEHLKIGFNLVQQLIRDGHCTAGHDVSDGGLITTLLELAFGTNCGLSVSLRTSAKDEDALSFLFAEECGVVVEISNLSLDLVEKQLIKAGLKYQVIGEGLLNSNSINIKVNEQLLVDAKMTELRDIWEETSFQLDRLQTNPDCVSQEQDDLKTRHSPKWSLKFDANETRVRTIDNENQFMSRPRVAVIREEGINGDREMMASLYMAGFEVADVMITDILGARGLTLDAFRGLVFPGGFSYADVLGSARGWAATMKFNPTVERQLELFKARSDTFSLGVCNGCQLMALLGWVGAQADGSQGTLLAHNESERFESRFSSVRIENGTPAIMLKNMHDSNFGVWVAHGEGNFTFANDSVMNSIKSDKCVAIRYTDDDGNATTRYPMNPNGSVDGIAGLCSPDGRHLAMMPHPERCTLMWQWPYVPAEWAHIQTSPWCRMFTNAYEWCRLTKA